VLSASVILSILTVTSIGSNYVRASQHCLYTAFMGTHRPCASRASAAEFPSQFTALSLANFIPDSEPPAAFHTRCYEITTHQPYTPCVESGVTLWCELIGRSPAEIDGPIFRGGKRLTSACNEWADNLSFNLWADGKAWLRPFLVDTQPQPSHTHRGRTRTTTTTHHASHFESLVSEPHYVKHVPYSGSDTRKMPEKPRRPGPPNTGLAPSVDPFASPPLRVWLATFWKDIFAMALMGGIALGVHLAPPAPTHTFPILFKDGNIVMPQFAYEPRTQIIPVWAAVLLAGLVPILFFGLAQVRVRSWMDFVVASVGVLQSLITSSVFQVIIKCLIGGLRPHFLAACQPVVPYEPFPN